MPTRISNFAHVKPEMNYCHKICTICVDFEASIHDQTTAALSRLYMLYIRKQQSNVCKKDACVFFHGASFL